MSDLETLALAYEEPEIDNSNLADDEEPGFRRPMEDIDNEVSEILDIPLPPVKDGTMAFARALVPEGADWIIPEGELTATVTHDGQTFTGTASDVERALRAAAVRARA